MDLSIATLVGTVPLVDEGFSAASFFFGSEDMRKGLRCWSRRIRFVNIGHFCAT